MTFKPNQYSQIPLDNLAENISLGPYPAAPKEMIDHYLESRELRGVPPTTSDEQLIVDTENEWQYDQHADAVATAAEQGKISPDHETYMLKTILRRWFIGTRNPGQ